MLYIACIVLAKIAFKMNCIDEEHSGHSIGDEFRDRSPVRQDGAAAGGSTEESTNSRSQRSLMAENPGKYRSTVYDLYFKKPTDDARTFRCMTCRAIVLKGQGGQTNLKKHYERKHHDTFVLRLKYEKQAAAGPKIDRFLMKGNSPDESQDENTQAVPSGGLAVPADSAFGRQYYYNKSSQKYKDCRAALAKMIATDCQPFSIVDDPGFLEYSFCLDPKFIVPSRKTIEEDIKVQYEHTQGEILTKIRGEILHYCATADIWTSRNGEAFISLTIHYINRNSWELVDLRLGAYPFPGSHDGKEIAKKITELLEEWGLPLENMVCLTCDNAGNNITCCEELKQLRTPCFGHVLNLAVKDFLAVRGITEAVARSRKLVEHFNRSREHREKLERMQETMNLKKHRLIQDVPTRWNATFNMLERLLEQKPALLSVIRESLPHPNAPMPSYALNETEWHTVKELVPILRPFYDITTWLSGSSYVTISASGPSLAVLKEKLKIGKTDSQAIRTGKQLALVKIGKYYDKEEMEDFIDFCTYMDPRFRAFQHKLEKKSAVEEKLTVELEKVIADNEGITGASTSTDATSSAEPSAPASGLSRLLAPVLQPGPVRVNETPYEVALRELSYYAALPVAPLDSNPLDWWKTYQSSLPNMSALAKKLLCVVATSVPSECLFSIAGEIVSHKRNLPQYRRMWELCRCRDCLKLLGDS